MPPRRTRIDRRLPQAGAAGPVSAPDLVVRFRDEHGELADVHDFTRLMLPPGIAPLIAEAFRAHYQGAAAGSRHGAYKALRTFACFLAADGWVAEPEDLDSRAIERYVAWLGGQRRRDVDQPRSPAARAQLYAVVRQLLLWTRRHRPGLLPRIDFPANPFPRRAAQTTPRPRLDDDQLKTVLEACYAEIDDAWSRFEAGRRMLAGDMAEDELAKMVRAVHAVGDGVVPSGKALRAGGLPFSRVAGVGGLRIVAQKRIQMTRGQAETFYAVHKARPFFGELVDFMTSGPVVVQVLEGEGAIPRYRDVMGATDPSKAAEGTIRKLYAKSIGENSVHGSDAPETAAIEIAQFFAGNEIVG